VWSAAWRIQLSEHFIGVFNFRHFVSIERFHFRHNESGRLSPENSGQREVEALFAGFQVHTD